SYFQPPIDTHLIDTLINTPSIMKCAFTCERNSVCRTADYNISTKTCRLFETVTSAGAFVADPTTNILPFNYCTDDQQIEPYCVCTRGNTYTMQQIFDQLALAPNISLSTSIISIYANMYGVYLGTSGSLSFLTYTGINSSYIPFSTQVTGINPTPDNGLGIVQYNANTSTIYKNIGTSTQPQLVSILSISSLVLPYSCVITSQYMYITYSNSYVYMTIHDLSSGSVVFSTPSISLLSNRPVVSYWNDTIIILSQYIAMEYTLNGTYKGNLTYFTGEQIFVRHCIQYDYAGRRHTCNGGGTYPGIYTFLMNGTQIARGPTACYRAMQVYITKDQAILTNMLSSGPAIMNIINF
ncbi:unnamed protein product, partial [Adineta steineri]